MAETLGTETEFETSILDNSAWTKDSFLDNHKNVFNFVSNNQDYSHWTIRYERLEEKLSALDIDADDLQENFIISTPFSKMLVIMWCKVVNLYISIILQPFETLQSSETEK